MSKLTEYGFIVIMALEKSQSPSSADSVSQLTGLETPTVSKVMKLLKKAGLLNSKLGANGGYYLVKKKSDISLNEVIIAMEGGMSLTECADDDEACHFMSQCHMSSGMKKVNQILLEALQSVSVSDIWDEQDRINLEIKS
ncbi:SUF system Fe-S cluster assembly regulator [Marinicella sp. S1101]|uniref:SUF system Fe-S cluster assembly regulator n=1 Tax=Marinicella marina TaxID=2996016 RepID=UPI002260D06E|nr:SUF system Fe-S cluster assembly regulator [Marinicella marina]MCX7554661.1 SUF system Fe-S cluster assembly regulator [Marinicella marina]MDJ1140726.1 SUF system Fe-S cluster assembly regulator [Marinicella marina]